MSHLEERVLRLERSLRRWRFAGVAVLSVSFLLFIGGATLDRGEFDELKTKALIIVNDDGRAVAHFMSTKVGPELAMARRDGKGGHILLRSDEDMALLQLNFGENDKRDGRINVGCGDDGNGFIAIFRKDGKQVWTAP
jgi:hypothetical protein